MPPLPPGSDSLDTTRFGLNSPAGRRERVNGNDLLRDGTVGRDKLGRDCYPPDPTSAPQETRPPAYHAEPDRTAHEQGPVDDKTLARGAHNHDYSHPLRGEDRVLGATDADYVSPFLNAAEGPNPWAGPSQFHMRTAVWDVSADAVDRIAVGPIEVWTRVSVEGGAFGEPRLRAIVAPGETQAFYEVRDVEYDPAFWTIEPVVEVYVRCPRNDRDPILKIVRSNVGGKIDPGFIAGSVPSALPVPVAEGGTGQTTLLAAQQAFAIPFKKVRTITATDTLLVSDDGTLILIDATAGAVTLNIATSGFADGFTFGAKRIDSVVANAVTLDPAGADTVEGAGTLLLAAQHDSVILVRSGTTWRVASDKTAAGAGGSPPTGTGFRHITVNVEDAAAKLVDTADINAAQVTYAKIQNVSATDKLLGRSTAGAGVVEEIALTSAGRALIDDATAAAQRTTLGLGTAAVADKVAAGAAGVLDATDPTTTNARTPTAHAASHQPGGSDPMAVDAAAATGSLRTIGSGALQAMAGNATPGGPPTGAAGGDLTGSTYPNPTVAAGAITLAKLANESYQAVLYGI